MSKAATKPLILAHRGASGYEPENTLRAFAAAYKMGADGLELDVFLTQDGRAVVTHNNDTSLLTGERMIVRGSTFRDLRKLDFGKAEKIPALEEVFDHFVGKFSIINVEIKSTGLKTDGVEARLAEIIKKFDVADRVLVSSFNPLNLMRFKKLMPQVPIGYLLCQEQILLAKNWRMVNWLKPYGLNLDQNLYDNKKTQSFFSYPRIWVWTVNTLEQMQFWLEKGVDAIITNYPDKLVKLVKP